MEKDLLDISGEDDEDYWLLKNTPKKGVSSFSGGESSRANSYLNCSPLQIPRSSRIVPTRPPFSPIGRIRGNNNMEQCSSVDTESVGKENTSGIKVELPKLSVERQQMKKKKKNAGSNLRKSLAWDRAFSTEEGVLDSSELSKITGTACQIGGDLLPVIQEDFRESMSASKYTSVSPGLQALEENLFNDFPVNSKHREKKFLTGILPKYASPSKAQSSLGQKKAISAQDLRSGSKRSGCPRPPPLPSLKRPANVHTTIQRSRELSISKASTKQSDLLTVASNMKKTAQSPSKAEKSQPTQLKNSQRSLGSENFSKITSSTKSKTKSSLASKSSIPKPSIKQTRRNVISKTSEIPSVSNSQHSVVGKSNVDPLTTSDVAMLDHASNIPESNVITRGTSIPQSSCNRVGSTQSAVSRVGKPSGLRVPSPSIGYFSQSESQPSQSAGDKHSQLPRSDICSASLVTLIPNLKKPQVAEKVHGVNSKTATGKTGSSCSALKPSQEKVKVNLKSTREVGPYVSCGSLSSQINEILQHPSIIQGDTGKLVQVDVAICTSEKISIVKHEELQSNSELPPSECKNNVQDGIMSDDNRDEKRTSSCSLGDYWALPLKNGPIFKDSMDSTRQGPSGDELILFNNYSQLKVSIPGEEVICTPTNDFVGPFPGEVNDGSVMKEADQLGTSDGCFLEEDASAADVSYSNEELEDNSELEDMDLVTESDSSDEEPEDKLERSKVDAVIASELISDLGEFFVKGIINKEYPKVEFSHNASDLCRKPKALLNESSSSSASIFGDLECLNEDTSLSRISAGMSKEDSDSGRIEQNHVEKAKIQTYTEKDFSAQVTDQEIGPQEEEEVKIVKISPEPAAFVTREEESAIPIPMNEAFSVRDDIHPDEINVPSDDILTSESSSSCSSAAEGNVKMIQLDAKLDKKPDPIVVKPPNAVPFSDEWLAAIEAAGEEILTLKSGRVQHSPTEKSAPEPGPWSPVKKKNNLGVGPFDCTKYNNKGLPPAFD